MLQPHSVPELLDQAGLTHLSGLQRLEPFVLAAKGSNADTSQDHHQQAADLHHDHHDDHHDDDHAEQIEGQVEGEVEEREEGHPTQHLGMRVAS
jgi:hypothetical protein